MTASILLDWAFGHAAGASGPELNAFLDMREHLRRALYRGRGLAEALTRMEAVGRWARIYCVHDLCWFLRDREAATEAATAKRILLALVAAEDAELRGILQNAIRDAAANSNPGEVIRSLEAGAARWLKVEDSSNFSTRLDYSDVEIFVGPTVILGLAAVLSRSDSIVSPTGGGALARLAATALSGAYGRLPFNLAVEWAIANPTLFDDDDVSSALLATPHGRLLTSPDIVHGLVRWTFLGPQPDLGQAELLETLKRELVCLAAFSRYFGVPARAEFGVVYWQDAVIALMLDIDLDAATTAIAHFWTPRIHRPEFHFRVSVPLTAIPANLAALLRQIWIRLPGNKQAELDIEPDPGAGLASAWPVLSPWLAERGWNNQESAHRLRWLCGLAVDIRVLESRAFDEISPPFVTHLLSSLPLLRQYSNFSYHREIYAWRADITPTGHLGWLSRSAWHSALEALSGQGRTGCRDLLFVIEDVCATSFRLAGVTPLTAGEKLADVRRRTTTGALRLLEDAIAASTNSAWSPWLDATEAVIGLHAGQIRPELERYQLPAASVPSPRVGNDAAVPDDLIVYGLLRRYLTPTSEHPSYIDRQILEEVQSGDGGAGSWAVLGRRLLLAPTSEATLWLGPGDECGAPTLQGRLVRALMRVSAAHEDPNLSGALVAQWRADLYLALREITDPVPFDRFARLKLIRMVADGVFDDDDGLLILVLTTLLHYGGPFHVRAVEQAIIGRDFANAPQVRASIFLGLTRQNLNKRTLDTGGDDHVSSQKDQMLEQLRAACFYTDQDTQRYLANEARHVEELANKKGFRSATADMKAREEGLYSTLSLDDPTDWIAPVTAEMVAIDATSARALVLHRSRSASGDVNAFARMRPQGPARHLGIVERKRGRDRVYVRVSPAKTVVAPDVASPIKQIGDLVIVDSADASLDRELQEAGGTRKVIKLDRHEDPTGLTLVSVRRTDARPASAAAQIGTLTQVDWSKRTFNFAGLHLAVGTQYSIRSRGHVSDNLVVLPQTRDFADLLLDYPALGLDQAITLSIHEVSTNEVSELASFVVEARPFELYRIYAALSLTPEARNALTEELDRLRELRLDPRGLLMTIRISTTSISPAIQLVNGQGSATVFDFPELEFPFDYRNLAWRERLSGQALALRHDAFDVLPRSPLGVKISRRRFSIRIPAPPGLPEQVHVILDEPCNENSAFLELDPETWDPWAAEILGVVEQEESLYLPTNPKDRSAAILSLAALKSGHVIPICGIRRTIRDDGRVYGFSDTNLQVLVNAESISLALPWDARRLGPERRAMLNHFEWQPSDFRILIRSGHVPAAAVSRNKAKALITRLPPIRENQVTCGVAWFDPDRSDIVETSLLLQFSRIGLGRRLLPGAMIEVALTDGGVQARILEPFGIADAIWCKDPELGPDGVPPENSFVGTMQHQGAAWDVHETGAGHFALRRSEPAGARVALRRQFGLVADGQDDVIAIERTRDRPRDKIWGASGRRCSLDCGSLGVVAGTTASDVIGGPLRLSGLQLSMMSASRYDDWLIERRFQVLKDRYHAAPLQQAVHAAQVDSEDEVPRIALGDVVNGRFEPRTWRLILSGELRSRYPDGVLIAPDAVQRAPILPGVYYPGRRATANIISLDPLKGSFTAAPECSLKDLALDLQAARQDDGSLGIDPRELRLVFVGREEASAETLSPAAGRYMFEWGYGRWVGLEEEQVRYDGGPIQNAKLLLFYGDRISAADATEECLLIESIAPSRGHVLYQQSRDHKVVNLLRVIAGRDGEPTIDAITGFDPEMERQIVGGALPHARLDAEGRRRVGPRLAEKRDLPQRVLGRLDTKQFEESCGKALVFNFRRLDLNDKSFGLSVGDRVFVAAGSIQKKSNDVGITIWDPGLHPDDADPSFLPGNKNSQLMLRRAFSIRQQALGDILELDGADKLKDSTLLVRLERRGVSLLEGALLRNPEIVRQRLRRGEEVLGVFGGHDPGPDWSIELSPGVMVGLPPDALAHTGGFYRGDVVVMRATDDGRISLALASPSDLRFVREGRPAVLLPKDTLLRSDFIPPHADPKLRHSALDAFSVGDLPDLNVSARTRLPDGRSGVISDDEFASFMCRPHPKIGELHFSDRDNPESDLYFTPGIGTQTIVGRIVCGNRNAAQPLHVRVVEFGGEATEHPSDWYLLSYADVPATKLVWLVNKGEKRFHDRRTTIWKRTAGGELLPAPMNIPPMTAGTGPLFFSVRSDSVATLRHPANELVKFASGPSALLPLLSRTQSGRSVVQVTVAEAAFDHLLVEHYPGQFLQLSAGMLQFRTLSGRLSMRTLDYTQFAAGDSVTLTADTPGDSLTVVELNMSWNHGPRNAFGPSGALLERDKVTSDATAGVARYGIGKLTVGLPCQDVDALPVRAVVGGQQHLEAAPQDPRDLRGCTVLLFIDGPDEKVRIHGLPQAKFAPSQGWSWDNDSLFLGAVRWAGRLVTFDREELLIRLRLAGGALPFTVEYCGSDGEDLLELSRRHQEVKPIGKMVLAVVEGQIGCTSLVQLRIGGRHLALPTTTLLPAIRPTEESAIFTALAKTQHSIWLRSHDKEFVSGYSVEKGGALTVAPREVVRQEHLFLGVVCEGLLDGRLYWLAANDAAAFTYSGDEAEKVFLSNQMRRLKVVVLSSGAVSIMQHPSAIAEVARLRLGASKFVDCIGVDLEIPAWAAPHTASEWRLRVCVSKQTSVTFALAADPRHFERRSLQTEVAVCRDDGSGPLILLAAANERITVSEAPSWLFAAASPPWIGAVTRFLAPSTPINGLTRVVESLEEHGELPTAGELIAMTRVFVTSESVGVLSGIALCAGLKARDTRPGNSAREALVELLRNLFLRSIRSAPLEVLAVWVLRPPGEVSAFTSRRRGQLLELFRGGRLDAARVAVERWLGAIDLEGVKPEEEALANAFGVLIGRTGKAEVLVQEARFVSTIISATRAIGASVDVMDETLDSATERLMQLAADLQARQLDIPLLPPLQLYH